MDTIPNKKVITRFAPSPTGLPHLGTAMYALLNYLYAHQNGGEVIMRSEDTDPVRSKKEYEDKIIAGLAWLGIKSDKFYRQSERTEIYKKYIAKMVADGTAYISTETNEEGVISNPVRFKNPNKIITFHDMARGDITVDTTELKDFVIARNLESPLYHLTVVVDDFEMGVTHIIRGEDGLANTPRQILIQEAIGAERPVYAHFPFVLLPNKTKMGKRNGAMSLQEYMTLGYLPEALLNFTVLMVWHPQDDRELFILSDLIEYFTLERIGKSGAILDEKKLDWLNKEYIKKLSPDKLSEYINNFLPENTKKLPQYSDKRFSKVITIITDRISKFSDITTMTENGELSYFFEKPICDKEGLFWKESKDEIKLKEKLNRVTTILEEIPEEDFTTEIVKEKLMPYAEEVGRGEVLWPMRYALSGRDKSPDPFTLAGILGKIETIQRLNVAKDMLAG